MTLTQPSAFCDPDDPGGYASVSNDPRARVGVGRCAGFRSAAQIRESAQQRVRDEDADRTPGDTAEFDRADRQGQVADAGDERRGRDREVDRIREVDLRLRPDADTEDADQAVEHEGRAAEDALGHGEHQRTELRREGQHDGGDRRNGVCSGRVHARGRHDADVLGIGGRARAAARTREGGRKAVGDERIAGHVVEVSTGHRGDRLDVAYVLRDQHDDDGQRQQHDRQFEGGAVQIGQTEPRRVAQGVDALGRDRPGERREDPSDDHTDEDAEAAEHARADHRHEQCDHERDRGDERLGFERSGGRRREVEADEGDDRPGDHRRHDRVDDARTRRLDHEADKHQHDTDGDDPAELRCRTGTGRGAERRDERERRTEIAGHPAARDDQEQRGADTGEQQRGRDGEARDRRHEQGGAEHRDDVLHPDADGARPRQSLVRCDHRTGVDATSVAVQGPAAACGRASGRVRSFGHDRSS
ncbi:outer membrane receptor protein [Rhodococcus pyridinivorans AK37]|uniref:Outer membrane receptor protein n=1 Tax=Rhodococcus pyridinivorans AK37 TaxID=1114960 RepID=H0JNY1_9NOCA|nr:outer membrane receptor protein [Rhodococcus pyridinivorans AK37]